MVLIDNLSASKIQSDLSVLTGGVTKFPQISFYFSHLLSLVGGQPLIGFSGEVIRLIIQDLRPPDAGVKRGSELKRVSYDHVP